LFRAYLAGFTLEYVPDMTVVHHHGRKTPAEGRKLLERYLTAKCRRTVAYYCTAAYTRLLYVGDVLRDV
jgi:GT2 family glycosyltransferase